jgi:hypothetical protein
MGAMEGREWQRGGDVFYSDYDSECSDRNRPRPDARSFLIQIATTCGPTQDLRL